MSRAPFKPSEPQPPEKLGPSAGASAAKQVPPAKLAPYATLEAWRGFASLWVVMFHTTHALIVRYPALAASPVYVFSSLGGLGVQLFFVISGYCITTAACNALGRPGGFRQFVRARVRRIYPPFWAAWTLAAVFSILAAWIAAQRHLPSYSGEHDVLKEPLSFWLSNLTLTQEAVRGDSLISPTWTLSYEVGFYLIVGLLVLVPVLKRHGTVWFLNALHALTATSLLIFAFVPHFRLYPLDLWPQFGLGAIVYDLVRHPGQWRPRFWLAGCAALLLAGLVHPGLTSGPEPGAVRQTFSTAFLFALALWALHPYDPQLSRTAAVRVFASVGVFSYSLYLIHMLVIGFANQIVHQAKLPERMHLIEFVGTVAAAIAVGRVFYFFFERPFVKPIREASGKNAPIIAGQSAE